MVSPYFDNTFMTDLDRALSKEYLLTSDQGAYSASTVCGCNTRKYHGVFVVPQPQIDDSNHVIVSTIDEQVTFRQKNYQLSTHQYPGAIHPDGHSYISEFSANPVPKWVFDLDGCILHKEMLMPENENVLMLRYTVEEAKEKIQLSIAPILAFRNMHHVRRASLDANKKIQSLSNGIKVKLYNEYDAVCIQTSLKSEFVTAPDWYYNVEYAQEQDRGYDFTEDLFAPGSFSVSLKKGDKLVVYIGLTECNSKTLSNKYTAALKKMPALNTELDCLEHAARQFILKSNDEVRIKAGYYWFGPWGRDTFISLPGLTLVTGRVNEFKAIVKTALGDLQDGLFPNNGHGGNAARNSVDAPLWFIWAIQQYASYAGKIAEAWEDYSGPIGAILDSYLNGTHYNIKVDADGLVFAGQENVALTWMDSMINGRPVTPRTGKNVEINALWYNAICFCLEAAQLSGDTAFTKKWEQYPSKIRESFIAAYWDKEKQYLADFINNDTTDWSVRPNQVFALSLPYSPVPEYLRRSILDKVKDELLTPKGLRTLSPKDPNYRGRYEGNQDNRDLAYHEGTVWPWLLGHYAEAYLKEHGESGVETIEEMYRTYAAMLGDICLYNIPEIYDGDEPYKAVGAVAQAWSVAEVLRMKYLLETFGKREKVYNKELA